MPTQAELWKKYSLPSLARMKPNPLSLTRRFTVPLMDAMAFSLQKVKILWQHDVKENGCAEGRSA